MRGLRKQRGRYVSYHPPEHCLELAKQHKVNFYCFKSGSVLWFPVNVLVEYAGNRQILYEGDLLLPLDGHFECSDVLVREKYDLVGLTFHLAPSEYDIRTDFFDIMNIIRQLYIGVYHQMDIKREDGTPVDFRTFWDEQVVVMCDHDHPEWCGVYGSDMEVLIVLFAFGSIKSCEAYFDFMKTKYPVKYVEDNYEPIMELLREMARSRNEVDLEVLVTKINKP